MSEVLRWKQSRRLSRNFVLLRGSEAVATLNFQSLFSNHANGSYGHKSYELNTEGVFNWRIRVTTRELGEQAALLRIIMGFFEGGELELPDGRMFRLAPKGILRRTWTLSDRSSGQVRNLMALIETRQLLEDSSDVVLEDLHSGDPDPLFLALVVWYFVLVMHQHEGAAASASAANA